MRTSDAEHRASFQFGGSAMRTSRNRYFNLGALALGQATRGAAAARKINAIDSKEPRMYKASTPHVKAEIPVKSIATLVLLAAIMGLGIYGCEGGRSTAASSGSNPLTNATSPNPVPATNPAPTISYVSPDCAPQGEQSLNPFVHGQLLVTGQNFVVNSVVRWNGQDRPTTFFSSSGLTAQISASDTAAAGTAAVTVFNPAPGGGSSNTLTLTITTGGVGPQAIVVDPTGKFAYVANEGCGLATLGNVSMYTINSTTGALASIGPPMFSNDEGGRSLAVDPSGKFVYFANSGAGDTAGSISTYAINATTGSLASIETITAPCAPPPSPGSCSPWSVVVDPSGKFAYVANEGGFSPTSVSIYTINATSGALTLVGTIAARGRAVSVTVDPAGKFAYVTTESDLSIYTINKTTGTLTSIGTITTGTKPVSVAVDPTGKFAYVANSGSNDVSMYSINATTEALTSLGPIAAGTSPTFVAVGPTGKFAYVANSGSNNVSMYSINASTGILTPLGTIAAGVSPRSIAVHTSGKFAYVANSGSNDVSMYSIDANTGALTFIGTIGT
jgi:6-phosphogluconolactonase